MKIVLWALIAAAGLALAGCAKPADNSANVNAGAKPAGPTPGPIDPLTNAKLNFEDNCATCHKPDGSGGRVTIKGEKLNVPNLSVGHALRHSDEDFAEQIANGGDGMPQFKDKLTKDQIHDLVRYIRQAFQGGAMPMTPGNTMPMNSGNNMPMNSGNNMPMNSGDGMPK